MLHVPQHEDVAVDVSQRLQCLRQLVANFFPLQSLGRNLPPVGEVPRDVVSLYALAVNDRLHQVGVFFPSPHTRLIDGDLDQPGAEARLPTELANVLESFQHRFLSHIFRVGLIAQNGECRAVDAPFVGPNQLVENLMLTILNVPDQQVFTGLRGWLVQ